MSEEKNPISIEISNGAFDGDISSLHIPVYNDSVITESEGKDDDKDTLFTKLFPTSYSDEMKLVESISYILKDPKRKSYGWRAKPLQQKYKSAVFYPNGCSWDAEVQFETSYVIKSRTGQPVEKFEIGTCKVTIRIRHIKREGNLASYFIVDVTVPKDPSEDIKKNLKKYGNVEIAFRTVCLDIERVLDEVRIPEFPGSSEGKSFRDVYLLKSKLKSGAFATVCMGAHRETRKTVATKCILRRNISNRDDAAVYSEVAILASLNHKYICGLHEWFIQPDCYFLVMDYMEGGDLFDRLGHKKSYHEHDAREVCKQLLEGIAYLHDRNIAHCDLKPKNLLMISEDDEISIKLADFGFATEVFEPKSLTKNCGTPYFIAPEIVVRNPYDQSVDMWSTGIIIYSLLCGRLPFNGTKQVDLFKKIVDGKFEFGDDWSEISDDAKSLIKGLLETDPTKRLTVHQALTSSWISSTPASVLSKNGLNSASKNLRVFNAKLKFKSAILATTTVFKMINISKSNLLAEEEEDADIDVDYTSDIEESE